MKHNLSTSVDLIRRIPAVPNILEVITKSTGMGFAAVARVTHDSWVACEVLDNIDFGLKPGGELKIETTICNEIRDNRELVVINNVSEDEYYCNHHTPSMYGFQSYISVPIILPNGDFFGTLCAIDPRPGKLANPETIGMFKLFAELIAVHIDARTKLNASQSELKDEQAASELREQFIAVLGHDLRNPLFALSGGAQHLLRKEQDEKSRTVLTMMIASIKRMDDLIDNVLDFARGRLGDGLTLRKESRSLQPALVQVIDEIRSAWPDRIIETHFDLERPFNGDHARLAQLFSNLLGNAITHGAPNQPVRVEASNTASSLSLSVANGGEAISPDAISNLFQPFYRGKIRPSLQGLGLGLFIASQIAAAHGGFLKVASDERETKFTLTIPA